MPKIINGELKSQLWNNCDSKLWVELRSEMKHCLSQELLFSLNLDNEFFFDLGDEIESVIEIYY